MFAEGHIRVHPSRSRRTPGSGVADRTIRCKRSVSGPEECRRRGTGALVDHERADVDELALERVVLDLRVLLVEEGDEFRPVVAAVALSREHEPAQP